MSFSPGDFDLNMHVKEMAFSAITKSIVHELEQQGKTSWQTSIGTTGITIKGTLTKLRVFDFKRLDPADRFGGVLASFGAEFLVEVILNPTLPPITDTFEVQVIDMGVAPDGVNGIALSGNQLNIGVTGLGIFTGVINTLLGFISFGIRAALTPFGLTPIPIYQIADAFAKLGISFEAKSPLIGPSLGSDGLIVLSDFTRAAGVNPSNQNIVTDLIPASSPLTVAAQVEQSFGNQIKDIGFAKGYLPHAIHMAGINFGILRLDIAFQDPTSPIQRGTTYRAKIRAEAQAMGKTKKSWWLSFLFGKKKVKVYVGLELEVGGTVEQRVGGGSDLKLGFFADIVAAVSVSDKYGIVMSVLLGPVGFLLFILLVQLVNIAADKVLPINVLNYSQNGVNVNLSLNSLHLNTKLFEIKAIAEVGGTGNIDLDQIVSLHLQQYPVKLEFTPDSLQTKQNAILVGAVLTPP